MFGSLTLLPGFDTDKYQSFIIPVSLMQGAGFTGAATGVNMARDIEQGWFDRLIASPAPRAVLLGGFVLSASLRALVPATVLLTVGFALGVNWPGLPGLLLAIFMVMAMGVVAACWGTMLALRYRSQSAAPLMQAGMFVLILFTTAYAPSELLQPWLADVASVNPVTQIIEATRQGFVDRDDHLGRDVARAARDHRPGGAARRAAPSAACAASRIERGTGHPLPQGPRGQLGGGRAGRRPLRLHPAEPVALPLAVVLGLLLRRDRLAALRARALAVRARDAAAGDALGRLHRPRDLLGQPDLAATRFYYNVDSRSAEMTGTIQPPLLAWAWSLAVGDPAEEQAIATHHEWLVANRDLEGDGLLWLIQPDESGLDSSPKFDPVWGRRSHARWAFPALVARNRGLGWDARRIRDAGHPVLCEVMTNVLWGLARTAMAHLR